MLASPANDFVADFFGRDDIGIKLLGLHTVADACAPGEAADGAPIAAARACARRCRSSSRSASTACRWSTPRAGRSARSRFADLLRRVVSDDSRRCSPRARDPLPLARRSLLSLLVFGMHALRPLFAAAFPGPRPPVVRAGQLRRADARAPRAGDGCRARRRIVIGVAAGIFVTRPRGREFRPLVESIVAIGQTFPPVAVLAVAVPLIGFGDGPALIALALYGLLPIVQRDVAGIESVPPSAREAADGAGHGDARSAWHASNCRLRCRCSSRACAVGHHQHRHRRLASTVGAKSLGTPIIVGLSGFNTAYIIQGALVVGLLAMVADLAFERAGRRLGRWRSGDAAH